MTRTARSAGTRGGFTLVELLVALVLLLAVGGVLYKAINGTQRTAQAQAERVSVQSSVRNAAWIVPGELRELGRTGSGVTARSDILAMSDTSITYRAMRGLGFTCSVSASEIRILNDGSLPQLAYAGYRLPQAGRDSLLVFYEGPEPNQSADDRWLAVGVTSVSTASTCGARPAIAFTVDGSGGNPLAAAGATPYTNVVVGGPVRTYEVMTLELYEQSGQRWLGARSVSAGESVQPVLGPLAPRGFQLAYADSVGNATTVPARVRTIDLTFRSVGSRAVHLSAEGGIGAVADSLSTRVRLRNAPRR